MIVVSNGLVICTKISVFVNFLVVDMGSIASVLQWHCNSCSLINPTDRVTCIRCNIHRNYERKEKVNLPIKTRTIHGCPIPYVTDILCAEAEIAAGALRLDDA